MVDVIYFIKEIALYVLLALVGFLIWFFKSIYSDHKLIFDYYTRNKETDIHKLLMEMETVKGDIKRVESDSKRYWSEHKMQLDNNQTILIDKIEHLNNNNKAGITMLHELILRVEKRIDKIED